MINKKIKFILLAFTILLPFLFQSSVSAEILFSSFSPSSAKVGDTITISGQEFFNINKVFFKNINGSNIEAYIIAINENSIKVKVPENVGDGKITIQTVKTGGVTNEYTSSQIFKTFMPSFDFSPKSGKEGDEVVISSNDNISGVSAVLFGGVSSIPIINNENFIQVLVPRNAKTGKIIIKTDKYGDVASLIDFRLEDILNSSTTTGNVIDKQKEDVSLDYNHPTIKFNGIVPICNVDGINEKTGDYINNCDFEDLMALVNKFINFILITLATPLFALIMIYVGFIYLTSGGDSGKISSSKKIFQNAFLGYIIALASWLIIKTILTSFGYVDISKWF